MLGVKLGDEMVKAVAKLEDLKVVGLDHNALVIDCGNGRIRLIALSDLVDLEKVEREKRDEELREKMEALDRIKLRDYMDPNSKTKENYED